MRMVRTADADLHGPAPRDWTDRIPNARALQGRRVLVVEDEVFVSLDVAFTLEVAGAEVVGATSVRAALAALAETDATGPPFDIALLDLVLGTRSTEPVADALRGRGIPFVIYTGNAVSRGDLIRRLGAPVVSKPILPEMVAAVLATHLECDRGWA